jgi:hypothetical protein
MRGSEKTSERNLRAKAAVPDVSSGLFRHFLVCIERITHDERRAARFRWQCRRIKQPFPVDTHQFMALFVGEHEHIAASCERLGLRTHIAITESVSLCVPMKS